MWREKKKEEEKEKEEEKRKKNVTCRERMEYHDEQEIRNGREKEEKMGTVHVRAYLCIPLGAASPFPNSHRPNASPFRSYHW